MGTKVFGTILPFITLAFGALLVHLKNRLFLKLSIIILCTVSFFVSLLGILVWYQYGSGYGWSIEGLWQFDRIPIARSAGGSFLPLAWSPQYSSIIFHMRVLMSDFISKIPYVHRGVGLAPCSYDNYVLCKLGIIPIFILSVIIAIFAASPVKH
jgi:hypothetical protein